MRIPKLSDRRNDNYLTTGFQQTIVGQASGAINVGSLCFNDLLLNAGSNIAPGTGINQRIGNKIYFTHMKVRLTVSVPNSANAKFRIIVGKSTDPKLALQTTNTLATAYVEGTAVLEAPLTTAFGTVPIVSFPLSPGTPFKILHDTTHVNKAGGTASSVIVDFTVPLALMRVYDNSAVVTEGSVFCYMVSNSTSGVIVDGTIKLMYADHS